MKDKIGKLDSSVESVKTTVANINTEQHVKELTKAFVRHESWAEVVNKQIDDKMDNLSDELHQNGQLLLHLKKE